MNHPSSGLQPRFSPGADDALMKRLAAPILLIIAASTGYLAFGIPHPPGGATCRIAFVIAVIGFLAAFIAQVAAHLGATATKEITPRRTERTEHPDRSTTTPPPEAQPGDTAQPTPQNESRDDANHPSPPT